MEPADTEAAAELRGVHKSFGATAALDGIDLALPRGEILALLGPNGAGKTTALGILLGLRGPDRGRASLLGASPRDPRVRRRIGVTPQSSAFPQAVRVSEIVGFVAAHYPAPMAAGELYERFGLAGLERRQAGGLSGGEQRRLGLALAFLGRPEVVFLDEPTTGLDVEARQRLWQEVRAFHGGGGTVLLTTHYLEEADALAGRVAVVRRGRLVAEGTRREITERFSLRRVRFRAERVPPLSPVAHSRIEDGMVDIYTPDSDAVVRELVRSGTSFAGLEVLPTSLEEAFIGLTRDAP